MKKTLLLVLVAAAACAGLATGCATPPAPKQASASRVWSQNCMRCHNSRSAATYSDAQWEVAMLHMRVRASLTPQEQKTILEFLQSGQ